MDPVFEFPLNLPGADSRGLLRALHAQLRGAILDGRLKPGLRLPSTRALSRVYRVSRNTAVAAYDLLHSEGYVSARRGSGVFVADALPRRAQPASSPQSDARERKIAAFWRTAKPGLGMTPALALKHEFRLGIPDAELFPFAIWRRLTARTLRAIAREPAAYSSPAGRVMLREAIARHVSFARAVSCSADDIVVTGGAQQAFDLLARVLVTSGRTVVAVENPGYPPQRVAFAAAGAKIAPVRIDGEGLVVERVPRDARVICVTPSHQFPLGCAMSARRRAALLDFAAARSAVVVEDDYDGEFRFGGRPLDALQTLDRNESVFYVGTFSKSLFPAIRLGYIVAPAWARTALLVAKQCVDWHSGVIEQETLATFIREGHLVRHVRRMRDVYASRRETLLACLERDFGRWLQPIPNLAGMHLAAHAASGVDVTDIIERARREGVGVGSLRPYYAGGPVRDGLMFGYGAIDEPTIVEACARLKRLWPNEAKTRASAR